ncbi:MAG: LysR family transcriptional regulator [Paracoccus sp. (in: a-proteobacteria)]|jgi:DNA-binding transcriptional LysR family regulator
MRREDIADLAAFVTVAEERSFTRAAVRLDLSQSALSQIMRRLEERLGLRLLARTTRSVAPTAAGEQLLQTLAPMMRDIQDSVDGLSELRDRPAGTIRITTVEHAAKTILTPILTGFLGDYPDITVEVIVDYGLADIVADRFDAGIRLGAAVAKDMIALRISDEIAMAVVAAPGYLARHGTPLAPDDLPAHRCITLRLPSSGALYAWPMLCDGQPIRVNVKGPMIFNSIDLMRDAALAGMGLACLPRDQVQADIAAGRLIALLETQTPPLPAYHFYYPSRRQSSPAFRLLVEALLRGTRTPAAQ